MKTTESKAISKKIATNMTVSLVQNSERWFGVL
ncbi:Hypothetical protein IALB_1877 [Ignavibacterium album JCM 16511]|uniref:Uncharacterized protein n=1 Tax=Ignavibacterium album (strain DSM 19864 / JCM 16511 / NBRC 101810 / Mat9-16) TaxID=945713 RepID=I0AKS6_IGNAJ|nr:Hypothetical protein IALB_1877 [Ignavibacterium album JCM 16511]